MEMQHRGINDENLADLSRYTQQALRVAPDMSLIHLLRKYSWTGTTFTPFTLNDQAPALLFELQAIEADNEDTENGFFTGLSKSRSSSIKSGQVSPSPSWGDDAGGDTSVFSDLSGASMTMPRPRRRSMSGERPALPGISVPKTNETGRGVGGPRQRTLSGSASPHTGGSLGSIGSPSPPPTLTGDLQRRKNSNSAAKLRPRGGRERKPSWSGSDNDDRLSRQNPTVSPHRHAPISC